MTYLVRGEDKFVEYKIDGTKLNGNGKNQYREITLPKL
ncbi:hypothetical protein ADIS_0603 [Lunatimonas lonarensis]|uniref:Uncharacterized protein n=1 Tax=Lunatimonas lonarensis TaxID=1232681 RepID=R7ZX26_9BACT|nr:hypothetical protein ADIS_0603 [Lunatimonas lonarensis]